MVTIRFYEELNYFLPRDRRKKDNCINLGRGTTTKKIIEDMGIPHTEVDLILVNGRSVDFSYRLKDGDRISVYPVFESLDINAVSRLRPGALRITRFILDVHLGKLARSLRMLGFDSKYCNRFSDDRIVAISGSEGRIILSRDRELLKRKSVVRGYCVRSNDPVRQIKEVIKRFNLEKCTRPFSRCMLCNAVLVPAAGEEAGSGIIESAIAPETAIIPDNTKTAACAGISTSAEIPEYVLEKHEIFLRCPDCDRIYWRGSHWEHMREKIEGLGIHL